MVDFSFCVALLGLEVLQNFVPCFETAHALHNRQLLFKCGLIADPLHDVLQQQYNERRVVRCDMKCKDRFTVGATSPPAMLNKLHQLSR